MPSTHHGLPAWRPPVLTESGAAALQHSPSLLILSQLTWCAGNCGNGPNMVLLPDETQLAHMSTPARVVQALHEFCGIKVDEEALKATELRLAGNNAARGGDLEKAISLYTQVWLQKGEAFILLASSMQGCCQLSRPFVKSLPLLLELCFSSPSQLCFWWISVAAECKRRSDGPSFTAPLLSALCLRQPSMLSYCRRWSCAPPLGSICFCQTDLERGWQLAMPRVR